MGHAIWHLVHLMHQSLDKQFGKSTGIGICLSIGRGGGTRYVGLDCCWHSIGVADCCFHCDLTYLVMMLFDAALEGL